MTDEQREIASLQTSIDNARAVICGDIEGEPLAGTLAHEVWRCAKNY